MPNNIARKIFRIPEGEQNLKVYDPAVTRGDLIKYDEEVTKSGVNIVTVKGVIDSSRWKTMLTNSFELSPDNGKVRHIVSFILEVGSIANAGVQGSYFVGTIDQMNNGDASLQINNFLSFATSGYYMFYPNDGTGAQASYGFIGSNGNPNSSIYLYSLTGDDGTLVIDETPFQLVYMEFDPLS